MRIGKKVTGEMYVCSEHFKQEDYFWSHLDRVIFPVKTALEATLASGCSNLGTLTSLLEQSTQAALHFLMLPRKIQWKERSTAEISPPSGSLDTSDSENERR
ncbi:hypothetical protein HPB50_019467 [Hyalomma asiaticum]|uniref:Uncharacterized protein n=1 Tax=Hyalomma asiaticum TaxID=266040 RepID=A0ACB7S3V0_HYAAI|nr:hypothetical protein HPB50_019467 [Hyalomma asiaticum]